MLPGDFDETEGLRALRERLTGIDRPEYVHCVRTGLHDGDPPTPTTTSWCGRDVRTEFAFTDASHAALNAAANGRLLVCPECSTAICAALRSGTWAP